MYEHITRQSYSSAPPSSKKEKAACTTSAGKQMHYREITPLQALLPGFFLRSGNTLSSYPALSKDLTH